MTLACRRKKESKNDRKSSLLGLLRVLDGEAPDVKVITKVVDDVDREVGVGGGREGETAPQVNVLHVRSKQPLAIAPNRRKKSRARKKM